MPPPRIHEPRADHIPGDVRTESAAIACPDCGEVQVLPSWRPRQSISCWRCRGVLERSAGRSMDAALACASATLLLLFPANLFPLLALSVIGIERHSYLASGVGLLWQRGWVFVAIIVAVQGVVLPFARFALLTTVLGRLRLGHRDAWLGPGFGWAIRLDAWAMADVYLIGCAIGYGRVRALIPVTIEAGGWALIGAALMTMLSRAALDQRTVWRMIGTPSPAPAGATIGCRMCDLVLPEAAEGQRCPRCRTRIGRRKPYAIVGASALMIAGYLLYLPANYFPMSLDHQFGTVHPHRVVDGVRELITAHLYPLALVIFTTSIAIPLLKLVTLSWLLLTVRRGWTSRLRLKTRLYRVVEEIGRWSNADVFTITVFLPLIQFHALVGTDAGIGAPAFLAVVVLTMFAVRMFDPRLMWDAEARGT